MNGHTWTDDDVQALVKATKRVIDNGLVSEGEYPGTYGLILDALRPFQPDPDAELVEKVAEAIYQSDNPTQAWKDASDRVGIHQSYYRVHARNAIAAVREHGKKRRM